MRDYVHLQKFSRVNVSFVMICCVVFELAKFLLILPEQILLQVSFVVAEDLLANADFAYIHDELT